MSGTQAGSELAGIFAGAQDLRGLIRLTPSCIDQFRAGRGLARAAAERRLFEQMMSEGSFSEDPPPWVRENLRVPAVGYLLVGDHLAIRLRAASDSDEPFIATASFRRGSGS